MFVGFDTLGAEKRTSVIFGTFDTKIIEFIIRMFIAIDGNNFIKWRVGLLYRISFGKQGIIFDKMMIFFSNNLWFFIDIFISNK
jgi:hypothetical protein